MQWTCPIFSNKAGSSIASYRHYPIRPCCHECACGLPYCEVSRGHAQTAGHPGIMWWGKLMMVAILESSSINLLPCWIISSWHIHWSVNVLEQQGHTFMDISTKMMIEHCFKFLHTPQCTDECVWNIRLRLLSKKLFYKFWRLKSSLAWQMSKQNRRMLKWGCASHLRDSLGNITEDS